MEHPDYPGYLIYNDGRIWSKRSNIFIAQHNDKEGYQQVSFKYDGKSMTKKVHRLVAQVYIPNPNNFPQVNHKNCIVDDNRVDNLEWVTNAINHLSYKMKNCNFGCIYLRNRTKTFKNTYTYSYWIYTVKINKVIYTKQFATYAEAKLYRLFLQYCFVCKGHVSERKRI